MICLDNTDTLEGGASVDAKVDYTVHGVTTTFVQLAAGQLSNVDPTVLYTAAAATSIVSITLVNTHTAAVTVNLYIDPADGGNPRRLIPKDLSLGIGYSATFDGQRLTIHDATGILVQSLGIHTHQTDPQGGQLDHGLALTGLTDDDHTQYVKDSEFTADGDFLVGTGSGTFAAESGATARTSLDVWRYVDRGDPAAFDYSIGNFTTDGTWRDLDLSAIVPAGAKAVHMRVQIQDDATASQFAFRENGNSNTYNTSLMFTQVANIYLCSDMIVSCDANRVVEYFADNLTWTAIYVVIRGWWV